MEQLQTTQRTQLNRAKQRACFDKAVLLNIIDEALVGHVAFVQKGEAVVIPTLVWQAHNHLYIHGSNGSRMLKHASDGQTVSIAMTLLDGIVLARSAFHHSANFRSAVVFGKPEVISDREEKKVLLDTFIDRLQPGRSVQIRTSSQQELDATTILAIPLEEASIKIRQGGPIDDEEDLSIPVWAGEIPFIRALQEPLPCKQLNTTIHTPDISASSLQLGTSK